jgi:hypothetical protein
MITSIAERLTQVVIVGSLADMAHDEQPKTAIARHQPLELGDRAPIPREHASHEVVPAFSDSAVITALEFSECRVQIRPGL